MPHKKGIYIMAISNDNIKSITIKDAQIRFRNFSGRAGKYSPEGTRTFSVLIPNEEAAELADLGWNINYLHSRDEDEPDQASLRVTVSFNYYIPPQIYRVVGKTKTLLTEDTIGQLDADEISRVDLRIRPRKWGDEQRGGVKAYAEKMYVTVVEDDLDADYNFGDGVDDGDPF